MASPFGFLLSHTIVRDYSSHHIFLPEASPGWDIHSHQYELRLIHHLVASCAITLVSNTSWTASLSESARLFRGWLLSGFLLYPPDLNEEKLRDLVYKIVGVNKIVSRVVRRVDIDHLDFAKIIFLKQLQRVEIISLDKDILGSVEVDALFNVRLLNFLSYVLDGASLQSVHLQ